MCKPRLVDAVGLDIVLEMINTVLDLRQDLAAEDRRRVLQKLIEGLLQRIDAVALRQRLDPPASEPCRTLFGVEIALEMLRQPRIAHDDAEGRFIALPFLVQLDRRYEHALHPAVGGMDGKASGYRAADVVMMAEYLTEADQTLADEDRDSGAKIGHVTDAAARIVGIIPEEHVAGMNVVGAEIFEHRLDDRRIGAAGELAAFGVEQRDPVVVLVADHRRARRALDRGLDLELGGANGAVDDFQLDRAEHAAGRGMQHRVFLSASTDQDQIAVSIGVQRP